MRTTPIPDATVLAAVDRAERHHGRARVPVWLIFEHLGIPRRSRRVRAQLVALVEGGELRRSRAHGVEQWGLTPRGRRQLLPGDEQLPESPQHCAWRSARTLAAREIDRFRSDLGNTIADAGALLDGTATSDTWLMLAERLHYRARRLGSATYCLNEWAEPGDDRADIDDLCDPDDGQLSPVERQRRHALRVGRRNIRLWDESRW
jgi:hypothetical protein